MQPSLRPIPVSASSELGLAASGSSQRQTVPGPSVGTSPPPSAPSGMSSLTAQALLTYLRGCGICDACASNSSPTARDARGRPTDARSPAARATPRWRHLGHPGAVADRPHQGSERMLRTVQDQTT